MSLRTMGRIVIVWMLLVLPLLNSAFSPEVVWRNVAVAADQNTPDEKPLPDKEPPPPPPTRGTPPAPVPPSTCTTTGPSGSPNRTGLYGLITSFNPGIPSSPEIVKAQVLNASSGALLGESFSDSTGYYGFGPTYGTPDLPTNQPFIVRFVWDYGEAPTEFRYPDQYFPEAPVGDQGTYKVARALKFNDACQVEEIEPLPGATAARVFTSANSIYARMVSSDPRPSPPAPVDRAKSSPVAGKVIYDNSGDLATGTPPNQGVIVQLYNVNPTNRLPSTVAYTTTVNEDGNFTFGQVLPVGPNGYYMRMSAVGLQSSWLGGVFKEAPDIVGSDLCGSPPCLQKIVVPNTPYPDGAYITTTQPAQSPPPNYILGKVRGNGTIQGTLTAIGGASVAGAIAEAYFGSTSNPQLLGTAVVDASGAYTITDVSPFVNYRVHFVPPPGSGLVQGWYNNDPNSSARTITTAVAVNTTVPTNNFVIGNVNARLLAGARITGAVQAENSPGVYGPIAGVTVQIFKADTITDEATTTPFLTAVTDSSGNFISPPGADENTKYKIYFLPPNTGGVPAVNRAGWYAGETNQPVRTSRANGVKVTAPAPLGTNVAITARLPLGAYIKGQISPGGVSFLGSGVSVQVIVLSGTTTVQAFTFSSNPGEDFIRYNTAPLEPNPNGYKLLFIPTRGTIVGGYLSAYYKAGSAFGTDTLADATAIPVDATTVGALPFSYDIRLRQGATLQAKVFASDSVVTAPFRGVQVEVVSPTFASGVTNTDTVVGTGTTDGTGNVTIDFIRTTDPANPSGDYRWIRFLAPPGSAQASAWYGAPGEPIKVYFQPGEVVSVTATLLKAAEVRGTIYDPANPTFNFSGTRFQANRDNDPPGAVGIPISTTTPTPNPSGVGYDYVLKLPQDADYFLKFIPPPGSPYLAQYYDQAYRLQDRDRIFARSSDVITGVNAVFRAGGAILVTVRDRATNNLISSAVVSIYNTNVGTPAPQATGATDAGGQFTHPPLNAGTYYVRVDGPAGQGYETAYYKDKTDLASANGVPINNASVTEITVYIGKRSNVNGRVTRVDTGTPVGVANVTVKVLEPSLSGGSEVVLRSTTSDSTGNYVLAPTTGNYKIKFEPPIGSGLPIRYYQAGNDGGASDFGSASTLVLTTTAGAVVNQVYAGTSSCRVTGYSIQNTTLNSISLQYFTDCFGDTRVAYGLDPAALTDAAPIIVTDTTHTITLSGLESDSTYYLDLKSKLAGSSTVISYGTLIAVRTSASGKRFYFAVGNTGSSTSTDISTTTMLHVLNAGTVSTSARIRYYTVDPLGRSSGIVTKSVVVSANTRVDVPVNDATNAGGLGNFKSFGIVVDADQELAVERSVYETRRLANTELINGGYTVMGATSPGKWHFPSLTLQLAAGIEQYVSLFNPNPTPSCAQLIYSNLPDGAGGFKVPESVYKVVPANGVLRFSLLNPSYQSPTIQSLGGAGIYSMQVVAGTNPTLCPGASANDVIAEIESYYGSRSTGNKGIGGMFGIPAPQSNWKFTDGTNEKVVAQLYTFMTTFQPISVTLSYQLDNPAPGQPSTFVRQIQVPRYGTARVVITNPNRIDPGRLYGFNMSISGDRSSLVVMRDQYAQWRPGPKQDTYINEGAYSRESNKWVFPGGNTLNGASENKVTDLRYTVSNPSAVAAAVLAVTYYTEDGQRAGTGSITLPPGGRTVINPALDPQVGFGKGIVGAVIESSGAKVVAERTVYWSWTNWVGGNSNFGHIPIGS